MFQLTYMKERDSLLLSFPYKEERKEIFRAFDGGRALPDVGALVQLAILPTAFNKDLLTRNCYPLAMTPAAKARLENLDKPVNMSGSNKRDEAPVIADWKFYRTPFKHQVISFKYAVDNAYAAMFLEMGLGKTYITVNVLDYFRKVHGIKEPSLVVIPLSSFESWEREFRECGSDAVVVPVLGSARRKAELLAGPGDVFLVTYESLRNLLDLVKKRDWHYLVLDESTKIKNAMAERSRAMCALSPKAKRRIILTGYPITQSYIDLFGQYKFLDPTVFGNSFHYFRSRYCQLGGWNDKEIVGYTNVKELTEKMFARCIRYTKKECLDLPDKTYQVYKFDLAPEERRVYDELKKQLVVNFKKKDGDVNVSRVAASNALVAGLRLVQICSGYVGGNVPLDGSDAPVLKDIGTSKVDLLKEVLENVPKDASAIIWVRFRHNLKQVTDVLTKLGRTSVQFHGDLTSDQRKKAIEDFQAGRANVFIGVLQAGGHGLNLTRASYVIYFTQDYSIERRMQSEDRAHRIGQTQNVTYIDLVAKGSIEESVLRCLKGKKKEADVVFEFARDPDKFLSGE